MTYHINLKTYLTLNDPLYDSFRPFDPVGLSVGPDGTIAVVSGPHHAVKLYYADGQHLKTYGELWYPRSVAFGPENLLV